MAEKDITEKQLEMYDDVFADIVNVLLFHGKQVITPNRLIDADGRSQYKAETPKAHEMERDMAKYWLKDGAQIRLALFGLEDQTAEQDYMPLRVVGYDGASYRAQVLPQGKDRKITPKAERYPVVTLVLHFGHTRRWSVAKDLYSAVNIPDMLKPYVSNYKINVFDIAFMEPEDVNLFQSDFREVASYFVQKRLLYEKKIDRIEFEPCEVAHVDEMLKLMRVMTKDDRFEKALEAHMNGKEICNMCDVINFVEERGRKIEADKIASLYTTMKDNGASRDDLDRIVMDAGYRQEMYEKYGLAQDAQ